MRNTIEQPWDLEVIAGSCSLDPENEPDVFAIADLRVKNSRGALQPGVFGTRGIVGLKSRTELDPNGAGMGIDFAFFDQWRIHGKPDGLPPSVSFAKTVVEETGLLVASEIVDPIRQMQMFEQARIPEGKLLAWNPAVNQLGWPLLDMATSAARNGWEIGIKNGHSLGDNLVHGQAVLHQGDITPLERRWRGLATYARPLSENRIVFIHRGVEGPEKGDFRNAPVHQAAIRTKAHVRGARLWFDPSHSFGQKLRDKIIEGTIEAMRMREWGTFLYDGILVEVGSSKTDTKQHLSVDELHTLLMELRRFRELRAPNPVD